MAKQEAIEVEFEILHANGELINGIRDQFRKIGGQLDSIEPPLPRGILPAPYPEIIHIMSHLAGAGAGVALFKGLKDIVVAWIKANKGREITIRVGQKKMTVRGASDLDTVTAAFEKLPEPVKEKKANTPKPRSKKRAATKRSPSKRTRAKKGT